MTTDVQPVKPPAFPEDRFQDLMMEGFCVGGRYDHCGALITLLIHGGGWWPCAPFHLYIGDVCPDPVNEKQALVLLHHPNLGEAPSDWLDEHGNRKKGTRATYLGQKFNLAPRNELWDKRKAPWKEGMLDGRYYMRTYWSAPHYGELFLKLWRRYFMEMQSVERRHPFAFLNLHRGEVGGMYCIASYNKAHAAACERIRLKVAKTLGSTPLGHRHAYRERLWASGVPIEVIRYCMHSVTTDSAEDFSLGSRVQR